MNRSTPGLPVHHQLPEFTQTHIHRVGDAIQPSHPLLSPSSPACNPSQHQGLFQWVNSSHEVAKVLEFQLQHHSLQRNPRADLLPNGWISLQSKGLSRVFSNTYSIIVVNNFLHHQAFEFEYLLKFPAVKPQKTAFIKLFSCKVFRNKSPNKYFGSQYCDFLSSFCLSACL